MAYENLQGRTVLLDACCLINLFASGRIGAILTSIPAHFAVAEAVAREALYIVPEEIETEDAVEPEAVSVQQLVDAGSLEVMRPESEDEQATYIAFALGLDDGEAMTCALVLHRGGDVATDDRKAIRLLQARAAQVAIHTTASLVRTWADSASVDRSVLQQTLQAIEIRGRFRPGKSEPLLAWWEAILRGESGWRPPE